MYHQKHRKKTDQGTKGPTMSVIELSWIAKNSISVTDISVQSAVSVFFLFWKHTILATSAHHFAILQKRWSQTTICKIWSTTTTALQKNPKNDFQALQNYDPEQQFAKSWSRKYILLQKEYLQKKFGRTISKKTNDLEQQIRKFCKRSLPEWKFVKFAKIGS